MNFLQFTFYSCANSTTFKIVSFFFLCMPLSEADSLRWLLAGLEFESRAASDSHLAMSDTQPIIPVINA